MVIIPPSLQPPTPQTIQRPMTVAQTKAARQPQPSTSQSTSSQQLSPAIKKRVDNLLAKFERQEIRGRSDIPPDLLQYIDLPADYFKQLDTFEKQQVQQRKASEADALEAQAQELAFRYKSTGELTQLRDNPKLARRVSQLIKSQSRAEQSEIFAGKRKAAKELDVPVAKIKVRTETRTTQIEPGRRKTEQFKVYSTPDKRTAYVSKESYRHLSENYPGIIDTQRIQVQRDVQPSKTQQVTDKIKTTSPLGLTIIPTIIQAKDKFVDKTSDYFVEKGYDKNIRESPLGSLLTNFDRIRERNAPGSSTAGYIFTETAADIGTGIDYLTKRYKLAKGEDNLTGLRWSGQDTERMKEVRVGEVEATLTETTKVQERSRRQIKEAENKMVHTKKLLNFQYLYESATSTDKKNEIAEKYNTYMDKNKVGLESEQKHVKTIEGEQMIIRQEELKKMNAGWVIREVNGKRVYVNPFTSETNLKGLRPGFRGKKVEEGTVKYSARKLLALSEEGARRTGYMLALSQEVKRATLDGEKITPRDMERVSRKAKAIGKSVKVAIDVGSYFAPGIGTARIFAPMGEQIARGNIKQYSKEEPLDVLVPAAYVAVGGTLKAKKYLFDTKTAVQVGKTVSQKKAAFIFNKKGTKVGGKLTVKTHGRPYIQQSRAEQLFYKAPDKSRVIGTKAPSFNLEPRIPGFAYKSKPIVYTKTIERVRLIPFTNIDKRGGIKGTSYGYTNNKFTGIYDIKGRATKVPGNKLNIKLKGGKQKLYMTISKAEKKALETLRTNNPNAFRLFEETYRKTGYSPEGISLTSGRGIERSVTHGKKVAIRGRVDIKKTPHYMIDDGVVKYKGSTTKLESMKLNLQYGIDKKGKALTLTTYQGEIPGYSVHAGQAVTPLKGSKQSVVNVKLFIEKPPVLGTDKGYTMFKGRGKPSSDSYFAKLYQQEYLGGGTKQISHQVQAGKTLTKGAKQATSSALAATTTNIKVMSRPSSLPLLLTRQRTDQKYLQLFGLATQQKTKTVTAISQAQELQTQTLQKPMQDQIPILGLSFEFASATKQGSGSGSGSKTVQKPVVVPRQPVIPRTPTTPMIPPDPPPQTPTPGKPIIGGLPFFFSGEEGFTDKQVGYDVHVRTKKKYQKINTRPHSFKSARDRGARIIDNTTASQFKVTPRKTKLNKPKTFKRNQLQQGDGYFNQTRNKYRDFRVSGTKKTKMRNSWIEKEKYRIDTPGESSGLGVANFLKKRQSRGFRL